MLNFTSEDKRTEFNWVNSQEKQTKNLQEISMVMVKNCMFFSLVSKADYVLLKQWLSAIHKKKKNTHLDIGEVAAFTVLSGTIYKSWITLSLQSFKHHLLLI